MVVIFLPSTADERHRAGPHGDAVDMHRAGAAGRDAAAVLGAGQADLFPQHPEQGRVGIGLHLVSSYR